jgi:general secretion pathway protein G
VLLLSSVGLRVDPCRFARDRAADGDLGHDPSAQTGLTLVELLIMLAIVGTLSAIIVPSVVGVVDDDRNQQAAADILEMSVRIDQYIMDFGVPPDSLAQAGVTRNRDPWGRPYEYLNVFNDGPGPPKPRKDHFLVPLNSDYDLYSVGPDGRSQSPLTAQASRDDIVRANNGGYIGLASEY